MPSLVQHVSRAINGSAIGRVTLQVQYPYRNGRASKPDEEYHCDSLSQAEARLELLRDWSSFVIVGRAVK